jgi:hypothetical protein
LFSNPHFPQRRRRRRERERVRKRKREREREFEKGLRPLRFTMSIEVLKKKY